MLDVREKASRILRLSFRSKIRSPSRTRNILPLLLVLSLFPSAIQREMQFYTNIFRRSVRQNPANEIEVIT